MKFTVTFKDPDGVSDSISIVAKLSLNGQTFLSQNERDSMIENRTETLHAFTSKWIDWQEYVTIEFDTETGTATVLES